MVPALRPACGGPAPILRPVASLSRWSRHSGPPTAVLRRSCGPLQPVPMVPALRPTCGGPAPALRPVANLSRWSRHSGPPAAVLRQSCGPLPTCPDGPGTPAHLRRSCAEPAARCQPVPMVPALRPTCGGPAPSLRPVEACPDGPGTPAHLRRSCAEPAARCSLSRWSRHSGPPAAVLRRACGPLQPVPMVPAEGETPIPPTGHARQAVTLRGDRTSPAATPLSQAVTHGSRDAGSGNLPCEGGRDAGGWKRRDSAPQSTPCPIKGDF